MRRITSKPSLLVVLLFSLSIISCERDSNFSNCESLHNLKKTSIYSQVDAYQKYLDLLDWMKSSTRSCGNESLYPEYYGGAFINDENRLVIKIRHKIGQNRTMDELITHLGDDVIYEQCDYSYNLLQSKSDSITNKIKAQLDLCENIALYGVDERNDRIVVYLYDISREKTESFKEAFGINDSILTIKKCIEMTNETKDLRIVNPEDAPHFL